jgi:hypothetical protein
MRSVKLLLPIELRNIPFEFSAPEQMRIARGQ